MEEQLITVYTAKLCKVKGIDIISNKGYYKHGTKESFVTLLLWNEFEESDPEFGHAPTQSFLQKCLREKYNIDIDITLSNITGSYKCTLWVKSDKKNGEHYVKKERIGIIQTYHIYEEALEKGLQEALKLIES